MKCPIDNTVLAITTRNNVEIDYCPECRGVWLDRGELDKFIDSVEEEKNTSYPPREIRSHGSDGRYDGYSKKKKKSSWIGEMFDF
jgi:Zn-finger nucleic acid-binding protein